MHIFLYCENSEVILGASKYMAEIYRKVERCGQYHG